MAVATGSGEEKGDGRGCVQEGCRWVALEEKGRWWPATVVGEEEGVAAMAA
ncbi:hypothetical protein BHM03_00025574 [Ensete ventricosum]|uniref:PWWP domain-containing protein n=1 Tax=Ensete ventricosum TaxID=4639 RepID=A0A445MH79_ENSVE|nr:hypothetical protein BHM03_00025574 [Ensete ventricosum]